MAGPVTIFSLQRIVSYNNDKVGFGIGIQNIGLGEVEVVLQELECARFATFAVVIKYRSIKRNFSGKWNNVQSKPSIREIFPNG